MTKERFRRTDRLAVEERVRRLSEQLMPLLDRANRLMIRNLKAIKELRQGPVPRLETGRTVPRQSSTLLKTADALGVTIPHSVLLQATEIIK